MPAFIDDKIARFKDLGRELGYRRSELREEINRQEPAVESYADYVSPDPRDRQHAEDYLVALKRT